MFVRICIHHHKDIQRLYERNGTHEMKEKIQR